MQREALSGRHFDNDELHRWLQATINDPHAACERIIATERWRRSRSIPTKPLGTPRIEVRGHNGSGHPCLRVRLREPVDTLSDELFAVLDEHLTTLRGPSSARDQLCVLVDVSRLELTTLLRPPLAAGLDLLGLLRAHYPQMLSTVHIVNLPAMGRWLVTSVCAAVDSRTAKKIHAYEEKGGALAAALCQHFPIGELPTEFGGQDTSPLIRGEGESLLASSRGSSTSNCHAGTLQAAGCPRPSGASSAGTETMLSKKGPRHVFSRLSSDELDSVRALRAAGLADETARSSGWAPLDDEQAWPDDELIRFLVDTTPPYNQEEALQGVRNAAQARVQHLSAPISMEDREAFKHAFRFDGRTKEGEVVCLIIMSRRLQDALLSDPEPCLRALIGLIAATKAEAFRIGEMETVQTVVQIERGFKLEIPMAAAKRIMGAITSLYPSFTSKILIVNLPGYLAWLVKFVKGFLCEASASKIEVVNDFKRLCDFFELDSLPSYYKERGSIVP